MFRFIRFFLILLSVAAAVLSIFAITGSYKNASYLNNTYLLSVQLNKMNLSSLLNADELSKIQKRDDLGDWASSVANKASSVVAGATATGVPTATGIPAVPTGNLNSFVDSLLSNVKLSDLGISDTYSISYWGYCTGTVGEGETNTWTSKLGGFGKDFDNSKVNYTWCSPPKVGYKFDPVVVLQNELNRTLQGDVAGVGPISSALRDDIDFLIKNINYDTLNWPGDMKKKLDLFNNITKASFGLLLAGAVLSVISVVIQLLGCFIDPHSCCLSFLNFLFHVLILVVMIVGSGLVTGTMAYTRGQVNDATKDLGAKSYLSVNFYAFAWSAAAATLLSVIFNLLGHCCGLFGSNRRNFRPVDQGPPPMAYDHFDSDSHDFEEKPAFSVRSGMPSSRHH